METLSDKIYHKLVRLSKAPENNDLTFMNFIEIKDVKEFIRELKKKCDVNLNQDSNYCGLFESDIDKLAGDKLI